MPRESILLSSFIKIHDNDEERDSGAENLMPKEKVRKMLTKLAR